MKTLIFLLPFLLTLISCDARLSTNTSTLRGPIQLSKNAKHTPLCYKASLHAIQGGRNYMEDRHIIYTTKNYMIAAVFDGHGGHQTAEYLKKELPLRLIQN